ncbi:MAG: nucleotide sugar dehydrogenase [Nitrososphaerales archaeon]
MKIAIIGSGTVGQATGIGFLHYHNDVTFCDVDEEVLLELKAKGYNTESISKAVIDSDVIFVCVPTPTVNGMMNDKYINSAITDIALSLRKDSGYKVIAIRSTVVPFFTRNKVIPLLEECSKLTVGKDFGVCHNPEFLRKASALEDFLNPWRIVIGEYDKRSGDILSKLYSVFGKPIFRTTLETSEMIKYVANAFLATKISFFNEVFMICKELNIDHKLVSKVVSLDPRIGEYGIHGGRPFKGGCLPKDLEAFIHFVKERGINPIILNATLQVNREMERAEFEEGFTYSSCKKGISPYTGAY